MKNFFICFAVIAATIFVVSCGGNSNSNSESSGQECSSGVFRCDGNILQKCVNTTWKNYIECQAGETCNAEKGECKIENGDDNGDSQECTVGEFKCVGDDSYYCDRGNSLVFDSSCENGCDSSTGECREDSTEPTEPTNPTEPSEPTTGSIDEGIYLGIIGFNQSLYVKDIGLLSNSTVSSYTSFIDNLASGNGTALYYADYTALGMLRDYQMPQKLKSVVLVTFTDGLDNMSIVPDYNPENYGSQYEYRDAIHDMIVNEKIHGKSVAAYTIGLKGSDITDDAMFFETLRKLASNSSNVFQVSDMDEVNELFKQTANAVYYVSKTVNLGIDLPGGYNNGQLLRFTFDNPGTAADSNLYIEATYSRSNGVTLENISYHGFLTGQTTISSESSQGYFYHLVFEDLKYDNGNPISDMDVNRVMLWKQTDAGNWNKEVEFDAASLITITEDRNSALIMLVLDCTTSLGDSDFAKMQQAGKDFVKTLVNGSGGSNKDNSETRVSNCAGLPSNAEWNMVSSITQTWDGSSWQPSTEGTFSETSSTSRCYFKCNSGYEWNGSQCMDAAAEECASVGGTWNSSTGKCTRTQSCSSKPANTVWNTVSSITQTYDGSSWSPSETTTHNDTQSTNECRYKCATGYIWSENQCITAPTRIANCTGLPANAQWNPASEITQTWNGTSWIPTTTGAYSETASTEKCYFKCVSGYTWNGSQCVIPSNPCSPNPCSSISNSTGVCSVSGSNYVCGCQSGYTWNGGSCTSSSTPDNLTLGNICTGQTSCYNASSSMSCPSSSSADFYGQDAQYTSKCAPQSFSSTNVVIDNNTGLTWEKSPSSGTYTWANRATHCNELNSSNYGGKSNWRVPNPLELLTIVDNSTYNPATNSNFTNMPSESSVRFWTSAEYKGNTSYAYAFKPYYGTYYGYGDSYVLKTKTYKVLCVSGDEMQPATSADFTAQTISGKVVVTDSKTGLMWQKEYATNKTWQQALKYCEDSTYAGYSDWRLPNKNELASLLDPGKSGAPYSNFPDMPSDWFWSSSTDVSYTSYAWFVYFGYGGVGNNSKTDNYYVRCVR